MYHGASIPNAAVKIGNSSMWQIYVNPLFLA
jgi:hypothetical protein